MKSKIDVADEDENFAKMGLNITGCSEIHQVRGNLTCGQALLCAYVWYGTVMINGCNETMQQNIIKALNHSSSRCVVAIYAKVSKRLKFGVLERYFCKALVWRAFVIRDFCNPED